MNISFLKGLFKRKPLEVPETKIPNVDMIHVCDFIKHLENCISGLNSLDLNDTKYSDIYNSRLLMVNFGTILINHSTMLANMNKLIESFVDIEVVGARNFNLIKLEVSQTPAVTSLAVFQYDGTSDTVISETLLTLHEQLPILKRLVEVSIDEDSETVKDFILPRYTYFIEEVEGYVNASAKL